VVEGWGGGVLIESLERESGKGDGKERVERVIVKGEKQEEKIRTL
jgi:hypothetical protein